MYLLKKAALPLFLLFSIAVQAQDRYDLRGTWQDVQHPEKKVKIAAEGKFYEGKSIERSTQIQGKPLFKNLVWSENTKTYNGKLINPDNGDEYNIAVIMADEDHFKFKVGKFIVSKTFQFKRISL